MFFGDFLWPFIEYVILYLLINDAKFELAIVQVVTGILEVSESLEQRLLLLLLIC